MQKKLDQSKKHKYYPNLIINRYLKKIVEDFKFKDVFNPYFIKHRRKFNFFTVHTTLTPSEGEAILNHKIHVLNYVTYNFQSQNNTSYTTEPAGGFLHTVLSI